MLSKNLKKKLYEIIFEAETKAGKTFDITLVIMILISIATIVLESVKSIRAEYGALFFWIEVSITAFFTIEYILRILIVDKPLNYIKSFFGIVDLISILPTYLTLFIPGVTVFMSIRAIRLIRIFRILKLAEYLTAASTISKALKESQKKISVFVFSILILSLIFGSLMYVVEGEGNGFTDIPTSIYWTVVTLTTVGYGDISPVTALGKLIATILMIMGFGIIAVPTGIVSAELVRASNKKEKSETQSCPNCLHEGHDSDAQFCKVCGFKL